VTKHPYKVLPGKLFYDLEDESFHFEANKYNERES
jgi:hypothetical protein